MRKIWVIVLSLCAFPLPLYSAVTASVSKCGPVNELFYDYRRAELIVERGKILASHFSEKSKTTFLTISIQDNDEVVFYKNNLFEAGIYQCSVNAGGKTICLREMIYCKK